MVCKGTSFLCDLKIYLFFFYISILFPCIVAGGTRMFYQKLV